MSNFLKFKHIDEVTNGWNAIFAAVKYGHSSTVKLLLDKRADFNAPLQINGDRTNPVEYPKYFFLFFSL